MSRLSSYLASWPLTLLVIALALAIGFLCR